jgi:predicted DNA binding CopG/RHH family protein
MDTKEKESAAITTRVSEEDRRKFRTILSRKGLTAQNVLAEFIQNYIRENEDK